MSCSNQELLYALICPSPVPMTEQAFKRAWEHYKKDSKVSITPHQLRHAFATILYEAEIDPKSAQKMMGHADYKTTIDIYTHLSSRKERIELEKLNLYVNDLYF